MISSTLDTPAPRTRWLRQALTIAPAALVMIVCVTTPAANAAGNSISPAVRSTREQSAPHMTAAEKERALTDFMRRDAAGEKIDPALLKAFIEAQEEDATTGIAVGQTAPGFELKDQNGRTHTLKSLMGRKGVLLVFTRSADW
jgi:AhpC/TSA family